MKKFPGSKGLIFNEDLLINQSSKGLYGISIPQNNFSLSQAKKTAKDYIDPKFLRNEEKSPLLLPEVSEPTAVRHFTRLSSWNICVDTAFYPLGSCTMKYNPKINETIASLNNIKNLHPLMPAGYIQPILKIMYEFNRLLCGLTGLDEFTFTPQAGAAGEFTGMKIIKKYFEVKNEKRNIVLIPDSSHGTNPASSHIAGFIPVEIKTFSNYNLDNHLDNKGNLNADKKKGYKGYIDISELKKYINKDVAAIMITNPNTFGLFEKNIREVADLMHKNGSLVYMDGANFNAFIGNCKVSDFGVDILHLNLHKTFSTPHGGGGPGSGPVGVKYFLKEFLPVPYIAVDRQKVENKAKFQNKNKEDGCIKDGNKNKYDKYKYNNNINSNSNGKNLINNKNYGEDKIDYEKDDYCYYYDLKNEREHSIGRISSFYGNFGVILRAYAYLLSLGKQNISKISEIAVLNANYIKKKLKDVFIESDPFPEDLCMHECVLNDNVFQSEGISTLDFAKSIIDYGFHPPTVYFPKNIHGAIMIEPTETESMQTMDNFISAMKEIKKKGRKYALKSPKKTKIGRINEVLANKNPVFK
ncbi:MAG: aminotransferase class V-fold PLP-dependent enzyme [bacterium]